MGRARGRLAVRHGCPSSFSGSADNDGSGKGREGGGEVGANTSLENIISLCMIIN